MEREEDRVNTVHELGDEDKAVITEIFYEEIVPKLIKRQARLGNLGCGFAGEKYRHWILQFRSTGPDFKVVDFEYDEKAAVLDL